MSNQSIKQTNELILPNHQSSSDSFSTQKSNQSTHLFSPLNTFINRISSWRDSLNLPEPGTYEQVGREVKGQSIFPFTFRLQ